MIPKQTTAAGPIMEPKQQPKQQKPLQKQQDKNLIQAPTRIMFNLKNNKKFKATKDTSKTSITTECKDEAPKPQEMRMRFFSTDTKDTTQSLDTLTDADEAHSIADMTLFGKNESRVNNNQGRSAVMQKTAEPVKIQGLFRALSSNKSKAETSKEFKKATKFDQEERTFKEEQKCHDLSVQMMQQADTSSTCLDGLLEAPQELEEDGEEDDVTGAKQAKPDDRDRMGVLTNLINPDIFMDEDRERDRNREGPDDNLTDNDDSHSRQYMRLTFDLAPRQRSMIEETQQGLDLNQRIPKPNHQQNDPNAPRNCVNCEGRFRMRTMHMNGKFCANCYKIFQSIVRTVEACNGTFVLNIKKPGDVQIKL